MCISSESRNVNIYSHLLLTHSSLHTFSSTENHRLLFPSPFSSLHIMQVLQCVTNRPRSADRWPGDARQHKATGHASESQFSATSLNPQCAASTQQNEKLMRAWTYTWTDLLEKQETVAPCVPPHSNTPTQSVKRVSQVWGRAAVFLNAAKPHAWLI